MFNQGFNVLSRIIAVEVGASRGNTRTTGRCANYLSDNHLKTPNYTTTVAIRPKVSCTDGRRAIITDLPNAAHYSRMKAAKNCFRTKAGRRKCTLKALRIEDVEDNTFCRITLFIVFAPKKGTGSGLRYCDS
jgi:hypothetical protein